MRYLADEEEFELHITAESKDASVTDASVIRDELEDTSERINPYHKSSRSMWPEKKLMGVSITKSEHFSGKITTNGFKISVDSYEDFHRAYEQLTGWLSGSKVDVPKKQSFRVKGFTFVPNEEEFISYDITKTQTEEQTLGHIYQSDGLKANYSSSNQGMVVFFVMKPDNGLPVSELDNHISNMLGRNLLVIGSKNEMLDAEEVKQNDF